MTIVTRSQTKSRTARAERAVRRSETRTQLELDVLLKRKAKQNADAARILFWANHNDVDTLENYPGTQRQQAYNVVRNLPENNPAEIDAKKTALRGFIEEEESVAFKFTQLKRSAFLDAAVSLLRVLETPLADLPDLPDLPVLMY